MKSNINHLKNPKQILNTTAQQHWQIAEKLQFAKHWAKHLTHSGMHALQHCKHSEQLVGQSLQQICKQLVLQIWSQDGQN